jgi:Adenylate and Guanylate cyclase catalytic domain/Double zinc ribbon
LICANCSTENLPGTRFCIECGSTLEAGCPSCGFANVPNAKFCAQCGTRLAPAAGAGAAAVAAAPSAASATQPAAANESTAERRLVSVLFADLVGFTPFAEERDAEDVRDTLTRYFDIARDVVERYGGTIEKFIGDAVMAVWGAPTAQEDDAERAVRAALDLVDAVKSLGSGIQARAGVLTGEAAVTLGATNQGMVAGDLVNTRLAPPGCGGAGHGPRRGRHAPCRERGDRVRGGRREVAQGQGGTGQGVARDARRCPAWWAWAVGHAGGAVRRP